MDSVFRVVAVAFVGPSHPRGIRWAFFYYTVLCVPIKSVHLVKPDSSLKAHHLIFRGVGFTMKVSARIHGGLMIRTLASWALIPFAIGLQTTCSVDDSLTSQTIKTRMVGAFESPTGATGEFEPITQTYEIQSIGLVGSDGSTVTLFSGEPISARIGKRPFLIHEKTLTSDFVGLAFDSFQVVVDTTVAGSSKFNKEHSIVLPSGEITYDTAFVVPEGQGLVFTIVVQWRGTITRDEAASTDTMSVPTFRIEFKKS